MQHSGKVADTISVAHSQPRHNYQMLKLHTDYNPLAKQCVSHRNNPHVYTLHPVARSGIFPEHGDKILVFEVAVPVHLHISQHLLHLSTNTDQKTAPKSARKGYCWKKE